MTTRQILAPEKRATPAKAGVREATQHELKEGA
jgi:hypothetical protein